MDLSNKRNLVQDLERIYFVKDQGKSVSKRNREGKEQGDVGGEDPNRRDTKMQRNVDIFGHAEDEVFFEDAEDKTSGNNEIYDDQFYEQPNRGFLLAPILTFESAIRVKISNKMHQEINSFNKELKEETKLGYNRICTNMRLGQGGDFEDQKALEVAHFLNSLKQEVRSSGETKDSA